MHNPPEILKIHSTARSGQCSTKIKCVLTGTVLQICNPLRLSP